MKSKHPLIIAEMSGNHNQSLERALAIVDAAADAGADALKIQTYTADTMTIDVSLPGFVIEDPKSLWAGESLYSLYSRAYTPWEWHGPIFERCRRRGIVPFSTPFDASAVDFLESLDVTMYKIASFENGDIPLLEKVAATRKPVIVSLGMIGLDEIAEAVRTLEGGGCPDITILKCTSSYPASPENTNLLAIPDLKARFPQCKVGLSDHTLGVGVALGAVALGAEVIEKHFTLSRADGGVDSAFSMEPEELRRLVEESRRVSAALGSATYELSDAERRSLALRRSVYVVEDIEAGEVFTEANLRCIRPGYGLHPRHYSSLLGERASVDLKRGTPMKLEYVK
ncbi:MAG: pseudaminic acid synthase [Kiritimatiellia bacterium]|jgi:pseudaminic acid synthase